VGVQGTPDCASRAVGNACNRAFALLSTPRRHCGLCMGQQARAAPCGRTRARRQPSSDASPISRRSYDWHRRPHAHRHCRRHRRQEPSSPARSTHRRGRRSSSWLRARRARHSVHGAAPLPAHARVSTRSAAAPSAAVWATLPWADGWRRHCPVRIGQDWQAQPDQRRAAGGARRQRGLSWRVARVDWA
jgi:hypothetical protein